MASCCSDSDSDGLVDHFTLLEPPKPDPEPPKPNIHNDVAELLGLLPTCMLNLLLMNFAAMFAHGQFTIGTLCSGTDLMVTWVAAIVSACSARCGSGTSSDWVHLFSCEYIKWKRDWIEQNFSPRHLYSCVHEVASGKAFDIISQTAGEVGRVAALWAGFSCKSVSGLNNRASEFARCVYEGSGTTGATCRSVLRYISWARPWLVFLENVAKFAVRSTLAAFGHARVLDPTRDKITKNLEDLLDILEAFGYTCVCMIMSPACFGSPNRRPRFWLAAMWRPQSTIHSAARLISESLLAWKAMPAKLLSSFLLSGEELEYWLEDHRYIFVGYERR